MSSSITGELVRSEIVDGQQVVVWRITALTRTGVRSRARFNNRVKGLNNPEITNIEKIANRTFDVTVTADR